MGYYKNLLPAMTAANVPQPYAVQANEQVTNGLVWYAVDKNSSTFWSTNAKAPSCWFRVDFGNKVKVSRYSIAIDTAVPPTGFNLEASDTGLFSGEQVILDSQNSVVWNTNGRNQYDINNSNSYRYYRVNFTSGTYSMRVQEFEFLEYVHYSKILLSSGDKYYSLEKVLNRKSAVPVMTSASNSEVEITANTYNASDFPWKAFDGIDIATNRPYWYAQSTPPSGGHWLQVKFINPKNINSISLSPLLVTGTSHSIRDFELYGSEDGVTYEKLYTNTQPNLGTRTYYDFENSKLFSYYRLNILSSYNTTSTVGVQEMELFEKKNQTLYVLDSGGNEESFLKYGVNTNMYANEVISQVRTIVKVNQVIESGKTFEHTMDLSKRRVDKITLG
ncbi:galactose-binding domain-containing protein [Paenibacillus amylolyticus]|uniref:galactose-binding domain-containing protein n=1 Tax=Paenibacillus amylolyticus TaxID=1451 RepID=UPI003D954B93